MKALFGLPPTITTTLAIAVAIGSRSNQIGIYAFNTNFGAHHRQSHAPLKLNSDNTNGGPSLPPPSVLCVGEALFDSLPTGIYLGGAPTNVAVHLASLFKSCSRSAHYPTVAVAACLGNDQLGSDAHRRLLTMDVRVDYIQFHREWETGMATAIIDQDGDATYEFNTPAAWDGLSLEGRLSDLVRNGDEQSTPVFVMGTIAGRLQNDQGATSFATLTTIRNSVPEGSVVLDVNLRSPWYTPESVLELAKGMSNEGSHSEEGSPKELAMLKLNEEELCVLEQWCGLKDTASTDDNNERDALTGSVLKQRMEQLANALNTQRLCVTRGKDGAALLCKSSGDNIEFYENSGYHLAVNNDSDTVGAGDAFLAALIASLFIQSEPSERALERACALGGYVSGCRGATPEHRDAPEALKSIFSLNPR